MPILKAEAPKFEAIKNDPSMSGMQKMEALHAIHSENAPQLQKILTPGAVPTAAGYSRSRHQGGGRGKAR